MKSSHAELRHPRPSGWVIFPHGGVPSWGWLLWLSMIVSAAVWPGERPDERVLWQLFHAGKTNLLNQAIREYQRQYPGWTPPPSLQRLRASPGPVVKPGRDRKARILGRIGEAIERRDWPVLIRLAKSYPAYFGCDREGPLRALALASARTGRTADAVRQYRKLLGCPRVKFREVLEEALWTLSVSDFRQVLVSAHSLISPGDFSGFDYRSRRKALWEAREKGESDRFERLASDLAKEAVVRRDLDLVSAVAWYWQERRQWAKAEVWFIKGLKLAPENRDLASGLLTASMQLKKDERVIAVVRQYGVRHSRLYKDAAGYLLGRAWELFNRRRFSLSRAYAQIASSWSDDVRPVKYLLGWLDLEQGIVSRAQGRFRDLYRRQPENSEYAKALVASYLRAGDDLDSLAKAFPDDAVLTELLAPHLGWESYHRKRFLRAWALYRQGFPQLDHIDSAYIGAAALYRFKSGRSGLDRLQTHIAPLLEGRYSTGLDQFGLQIGFQGLDSGQLQESGIRTLQAVYGMLSPAQRHRLEDEARGLRSNPPTRRGQTALLGFSWRREGSYNPYFSLGFTPLGDSLAPRPTFRLGVGDWLNLSGATWRLRWNGEAYSQPVRQSLLAYTGWKMLGKRWGRVLKNGIGMTGLLQHGGSGWNLYQSLDVAFLDGTGTKDNWMLGFTLAPGYDFGWRTFDYFTLGPYFNFLHYGNNQNHFRPGHGGYFSPQAFYGGGLQLGMQTREGRTFVVEGRLALGVQHFHEARVSWYPRGCGSEWALCAANPDYPANRETSFAPSGRLRFVWRIHPHWQLVGGIYGQRTSGYEEFGAGVSLRWLFEPRPAVFSSDLPAFLFGIVQ